MDEPRHHLRFRWLPGLLGICRHDPTSPIPDWALEADGPIHMNIRTEDERTVVLPDSAIPDGVTCERGWVAGRVCGTLDFTLVGILSQLTGALAEGGVSVFAVSTFDTDYLLVREADQASATVLLQGAGVEVVN